MLKAVMTDVHVAGFYLAPGLLLQTIVSFHARIQGFEYFVDSGTGFCRSLLAVAVSEASMCHPFGPVFGIRAGTIE